jgi:hypothetical protein
MTAPETDDRDDRKRIGTEQPTGLDSATTTIGSEPAWAHLQAPDADGRAHFEVKAEWLRDERGSVELATRLGGFGLIASLDPDDARALASKLTSAASYAEDGGR